ncbi:MAG: hypothetical protein FWC87_12415 [Acidimicrobiaceae bacterium]|nr:hypothetical protein [Acidimicrobiaceae bacterium]
MTAAPPEGPATSPFPADPVVRATGIIGLGAVAGIHFSQVVPTTGQTPWLGAAFIALILACVFLAGVLLHRGDRRIWVAVAALNASAIFGYLFTRLVSTPFDNTDVGNWSEMLGVTALFFEAVLVLLSIHAIAGRPLKRSPQVALADFADSTPVSA